VSLFVAGALCLLAVAFFILTLRRSVEPRAADRDDPNLAWLRAREAEIGEDDAELVEEARLRLLEDGLDPDRETVPGTVRRYPAFALLAVLVIAVAAIYWRTGAVEDVLIYRALQNMSSEDGPGSQSGLLERIAARSDARPENVQYLNLLGQLYMGEEDYAAAARAFGRLAEQAPEDPQALALAAQARFLAAGRTLEPQAQLLAEKALAVDSQQRTALGLLGMAAFEAGEFGGAVTYWERLQALEAPGSPGYRMLGEVLALARQRAGLPAAEVAATTGQDAPDGAGTGISVDLRMADAVAADPAAVVFVFARPAGRGGMPVAVRRLAAGQLPLTLRLSDEDAMAGQRLSQAGEVIVTAQISANGQPGEANALFIGASDPISAGGAEAAVAIELTPKDGRG